jgi:hypothetical protein
MVHRLTSGKCQVTVFFFFDLDWKISKISKLSKSFSLFFTYTQLHLSKKKETTIISSNKKEMATVSSKIELIKEIKYIESAHFSAHTSVVHS